MIYLILMFLSLCLVTSLIVYTMDSLDSFKIFKALKDDENYVIESQEDKD